MRCAFGPIVTGSVSGRASRFHNDAARRGKSAIGDVRIGPLPPPLPGGVRRVHTARPDRQRSSSQVKS